MKHEKKRFNSQMRNLVFSLRTWGTFLEVLLAMSLEWCWEENDLTNKKSFTTLFGNTISWFTQNWLSTVLLATSIVAMLSLHFKARNRGHNNHWTVHELCDIQLLAIQTSAQNFSSKISHWLETCEQWKNTLCIFRCQLYCFDV